MTAPRLTDAQRRALLALPADGAAVVLPQERMRSSLPKLLSLRLIAYQDRGVGKLELWHLTQPGIALRARLAEEVVT